MYINPILIMPRHLCVLRAIARSTSGLSAAECGAASVVDASEPNYGPLGQEGYGRFLAHFLSDVGLCALSAGGRFVITSEGTAWLKNKGIPR